MSTPPEEAGDPLEPVLHEVESELRRRLREACEAEASGTSNDSVLEIRKLEDALLGAAVAAEQSIALRRRIERRKEDRARNATGAPEHASAPAALEHDTATPAVRVREFRDGTGQLWRAWPVTPGQARHGRTAERYLGDFHKGWVCFEALEHPGRRRLPVQPAHWSELPDSELVRMLEQAIAAPSRKRSREDAARGRTIE